MDPLVIAGVHLAKEAFKWLSSQDSSVHTHQTYTQPQTPTYPQISILKFNNIFSLEADSSGIYAIHPVRLVQSELLKLEKEYGSLDHLLVLISECDQAKHGLRLQLPSYFKTYFEVYLKDLIQAEEQGERLAFIRDKIGGFSYRDTMIAVFDEQNNSIVGLSYLNYSLVYSNQFHILEVLASLGERFYSYETADLITYRACQASQLTGLERRYSLAPSNTSQVVLKDQHFTTLRAVYSSDKSDVKHFKKLIKEEQMTHEQVQMTLGGGFFEEYDQAQGVLKVNFQISYAHQCKVIGQLRRDAWSNHISVLSKDSFTPIEYEHFQAYNHDTENIYFFIDAKNPIYLFRDYATKISFDISYKGFFTPDYTWNIELPEDIYEEVLLDQVVIQALQILDYAIGVDFKSEGGGFVVARVISFYLGEEYVPYAHDLLMNYHYINDRPKTYSEESIALALMTNILINPFSYMQRSGASIDELLLLKGMSKSNFVQQSIIFILSTQLTVENQSPAEHYLLAYEQFLGQDEVCDIFIEDGVRYLLFSYKKMLFTNYLAIGPRELRLYSKDRTLKYVFDMATHIAHYEGDVDSLRLILNNGKIAALRVNPLLLGLIQNLICINRGGAPISNSNLNVPSFQKSTDLSLLGHLSQNETILEGIKVFRRELGDFKTSKAIALIVSGLLGTLLNMSPSDTQRITLQIYKFFRELPDSDKEKVKGMLSVIDSWSKFEDILNVGQGLDHPDNVN